MPPTESPHWAFEPDSFLGRPAVVVGPLGLVATLADPADGPVVARAPRMLALLRKFANLRTGEDYPALAAEALALIDSLEEELAS